MFPDLHHGGTSCGGISWLLLVLEHIMALTEVSCLACATVLNFLSQIPMMTWLRCLCCPQGLSQSLVVTNEAASSALFLHPSQAKVSLELPPGYLLGF